MSVTIGHGANNNLGTNLVAAAETALPAMAVNSQSPNDIAVSGHVTVSCASAGITQLRLRFFVDSLVGANLGIDSFTGTVATNTTVTLPFHVIIPGGGAFVQPNHSVVVGVTQLNATTNGQIFNYSIQAEQLS